MRQRAREALATVLGIVAIVAMLPLVCLLAHAEQHDSDYRARWPR